MLARFSPKNYERRDRKPILELRKLEDGLQSSLHHPGGSAEIEVA